MRLERREPLRGYGVAGYRFSADDADRNAVFLLAEDQVLDVTEKPAHRQAHDMQNPPDTSSAMRGGGHQK